MKRTFISLLLLIILGLCVSQPAGAELEASLPIAENLELKTYRNVSVGGKLKGYDPQGGELKFVLCTEPVKGTVELEEDGSFVYTPKEGKKGRDYFGYKVSDSEGRLSQEATVIIRLEKQKNDVFYPDMQGRAEEYSAVLLSEKDIITGQKLGGMYCFEPDSPVSLGEFVSLSMLVSDKITPAVLSTGYGDDSAIPVWMKPYAAAAAMSGAYSGKTINEELVFGPDTNITKAEAALILDRALGISKVSYIASEDAVFDETVQACINLESCGIIEESSLSEDILTRADMAAMLAAALALMENR